LTRIGQIQAQLDRLVNGQTAASAHRRRLDDIEP
jgi:hypothetical protein